MFIRNIRKSDYKAVDNLLLQLHQQDVTSRPDLFSPTDHYMTKESFDNLVESRHVMTILAQQRMEILGCCFVSMLETVLKAAKESGFEQAELEVISENQNAIALYEKLGFRKYGTFPDNMKYADGHYVFADWMMKKL